MEIRMSTRLVNLLPCLLAAAACGDNESLSSRLDSGTQDAPAAGPASRVWATGALLVEGRGIAAGFTDGEGALPFGPTNPPPIQLEDVVAFDARGGKIVFGNKNLTVANADGTNQVVIHQITAANV